MSLFEFTLNYRREYRQDVIIKLLLNNLILNFTKIKLIPQDIIEKICLKLKNVWTLNHFILLKDKFSKIWMKNTLNYFKMDSL